MSKKELSPDAQLIMDALYKMLDHMKKHKARYLNKSGLEYFIQCLEKNLGING